MFGFDKSTAPDGKGVIKVELFSDYKMWEELSQDKQKYKAEKDKVAKKAIELLEKFYPGISSDVEVIDVPTMMTWSRFMGGSYGFMIIPNKKSNIIGSIMGFGNLETLPGLANFRFVGTWATSAGALFSNALSGKSAIRKVCDEEWMRFKV
jgi:phytoene dehydrogenase-like protein